MTNFNIIFISKKHFNIILECLIYISNKCENFVKKKWDFNLKSQNKILWLKQNLLLCPFSVFTCNRIATHSARLLFRVLIRMSHHLLLPSSNQVCCTKVFQDWSIRIYLSLLSFSSTKQCFYVTYEDQDVKWNNNQWGKPNSSCIPEITVATFTLIY